MESVVVRETLKVCLLDVLECQTSIFCLHRLSLHLVLLCASRSHLESLLGDLCPRSGSRSQEYQYLIQDHLIMLEKLAKVGRLLLSYYFLVIFPVAVCIHFLFLALIREVI